MDFINDNEGKLYRKYLSASLFSALVMSIYSAVDAIVVGQAEGPIGAAAMAVITPLYGILAVIPILIGIGGSVLLSNARGAGDDRKANNYFTCSTILMGIVSILIWIAFSLFPHPIFTFFGADEMLYSKVMEYAVWIIAFFPMFLANMFISSFVRNDGAPNLAMTAMIVGASINMFLDWLFVFPMEMGMRGAAIATVTGTCVQVLILSLHFFRKQCVLRLVKPVQILRTFGEIVQMGFGAAILDSGNVVLPIMMNNQIMKYGGATELAIYGVIITTGSLFQAMFNGIGQAMQPLVSVNYGAGEKDRVNTFWQLSIKTAIILGILFLLIGELIPNVLISIFIKATSEVLTAAPGIIRLYFPIYIPLGITVAAIYYLQSTLHDKMSMLIAVLRSVVLSGIMIYLLPVIIGLSGIWVALPFSEVIVAALAVWYIRSKVNV